MTGREDLRDVILGHLSMHVQVQSDSVLVTLNIDEVVDAITQWARAGGFAGAADDRPGKSLRATFRLDRPS